MGDGMRRGYERRQGRGESWWVVRGREKKDDDGAGGRVGLFVLLRDAD